ncbi:MAG: hypothetical protein IKE70_01045 [Bacilli bacterium]|nr:hypothetical protein [Bacilli bacterium]
MILFILIGVVLLFVGCITILLYTKEDNVCEIDKTVIDDMNNCFEDKKYIDDELI